MVAETRRNLQTIRSKSPEALHALDLLLPRLTVATAATRVAGAPTGSRVDARLLH